MEEKTELVNMAAKIVSAYVGKNLVSTGELTDLIHQVYGALQRTMGPDGTRVVGPPCRASQEIGVCRLHHLSRRWVALSLSEAASADQV